MKLKELADKLDVWLRETKVKQMKRQADMLERKAAYLKLEKPYAERIQAAKKVIDKNKVKKDPLDMTIEI